MAEKKYSLPKEVRDDIQRIWGWSTPDFSHAAKQAVCWVNDHIYLHDLNAQVDIAISAGRLVEQLRGQGSDVFIKAFEDKLLNDTSPSSNHDL